jgi:riboflavin biosynthesis pyrimidine reductase
MDGSSSVQIRKCIQAMNSLPPLDVLYDMHPGPDLPLPGTLTALYGHLGFPLHTGRPHVISNFVTTLDGVVSLGIGEKTDGDEISGFNQHDSMVMALLRAVSDAVIVGAGSLRKSSRHIWTAEHVYPSLSEEYRQLRRAVDMEQVPLNVFITGSGNIDPSLPVFHAEGVPVAIITTSPGAEEIRKRGMPERIQVVAASNAPPLTARKILDALSGVLPRGKVVMVEGGPHLIGYFFGEGYLDELFLTLAPQVAGRDGRLERLGLVAGRIFPPEHSVWGKLLSLRRAGEHLFLRYSFSS